MTKGLTELRKTANRLHWARKSLGLRLLLARFPQIMICDFCGRNRVDIPGHTNCLICNGGFP